MVEDKVLTVAKDATLSEFANLLKKMNVSTVILSDIYLFNYLDLFSLLKTANLTQI